MPSPAAIDRSIRRHVVERARELGGLPREQDIRVEWADLETPPGTKLFHARWDDREGNRGIAGAWFGGEIDSRPLDAIGRLLAAWRAGSGRLPEPAVVAATCAFLLDAEDRHRALIGPADSWPASVTPELRRQLSAPAYAAEAELPLAFWWLDELGQPVRVEIGRDRNGRITFGAAPLRNGADVETTKGNPS